MTWEHFYHAADIGVRGRGSDLPTAFAEAATALTAVVTEPERVEPKECIEINCRAPDIEILFLDWLNALIYEMATRGMLFSRFEPTIEGEQLMSRVWGEAVDRVRHQPVVEPKGATFTELRVAREEDGSWMAQCVVDV